MISPSIGRVVWFHPSITDHSLASGGDQPLPALVAHVWSDTCINLAVFDANGKPHGKTSVLLLQDDAIAPEGGYYAEWMPFQKGQAAKHDATEAKPVSQYAPHQQRVLDEKAELDGRLTKLNDFLCTPIFASLDPQEAQRLMSQAQVMANYSTILRDRIDAFV
jgi:hypothetical protein